MRIYLARHGETEANRKKVYLGAGDEPLNAAGREQARRLGKALQGAGIDACYSSPKLRCLQTARMVYGGKIITMEGFAEIDFGSWEYMTYDEIRQKFPDNFRSYLNDFINHTFPGGESVRGFIERVCRSAEHIVSMGGENVLIVAHFGVIAAAYNFLERGDAFAPFSVHMENAGFITVEVTKKK